MKLFFLFCFYSIDLLYSAATNFTLPTDKVQCPCPQGIDDECTTQSICVYGINDDGEIFHNGKKDIMDLTIIATKRKAEIGNNNNNDNDDVLVNLYNPYNRTMAIFYYGCRRCEDLVNFGGNITVSKLKIFLLSLYNQRMKYNIKYSQSDFVYYNGTVNEQQAMPEINVRPFWKNRLMLNQTCSHKKQDFTQKHFIPAFLTQDLCILDYIFIQYVDHGRVVEISQTDNGEITYSLTLSNNELYTYNIISNSTSELPPEFRGEEGMCKFTFYLEANERMMRFFCLCETHSCTLKVTQKDPKRCCPYALKFKVDNAFVYPSLIYATDFMNIDKFFFQDEAYANQICGFVWQTYGNKYEAYIRISDTFPLGYTFNTTFTNNEQKSFCPLTNYSNEDIQPVRARFFNTNTTVIRDASLKALLDHSHVLNDIISVGANCLTEGPLSHPYYSSTYGSNASKFKCYHYYDIYKMRQVYPMMGINLVPVTVSKGERCYYYTVKIDSNSIRACENDGLDPIMVLVGCPDDVVVDDTEVKRIQNVVSACPTMKNGETQWKYNITVTGQVVICGQFLRGLKLQDGKYIPEEVELRKIRTEDLIMTGMINYEKEQYIFHGCGFDPSQNLTLCTCYAALGGCDDLYTVGRVHLLRYLPFDDINI